MYQLEHTSPAPVAPTQKLLVRRSAAQSALGWMPDGTFDRFLKNNGIEIIILGRLKYVKWEQLCSAVERLESTREGVSA